MKSLRVAVIGAGITGSATACVLARQGCGTLLFDQHEPFHGFGASHGATRAIRLAYFEHPDYVPLLRRAFEQWRMLESISKTQILCETGILETGPEDGSLMTGIRRSAERHQLSLTDLTSSDVRVRFPWLQLPAGADAIVERKAGYIFAERALRAFQSVAQENGAQLHWNEPARRISLNRDAITVTTNNGAYKVDKLVLAPGPWANELFTSFDLTAPCPITPVKKIHCWVSPGAEQARANEFLTFLVETRDGRLFYGFPPIDEGGVKVGEHTGGEILARAAGRSDEYPEEEAAIMNFLRDYAPSLPRAINHRSTCLYEVSPDGNFIIDRTVEDSRIAYAIGLSGHGFKFAPVIGEILANMTLEKPVSPAADFLSAKRFGIA